MKGSVDELQGIIARLKYQNTVLLEQIKTMVPVVNEYLMVSDKTTEIIVANDDIENMTKMAGLIRKAGGEVTIFMAIKG